MLAWQVNRTRGCFWLCLFTLATFYLAGCIQSDPQTASNGANQDEISEDPKQKKEDFETEPVVLVPGHYQDEAKLNRIKLGHWVQANLRITANNFDANGQLHLFSVDTRGAPIPIPGTKFHAELTRPVALPKGQRKNFEAVVYLPKRDASVTAAAANIRCQIAGASGLNMIDVADPVLLMKPYQFHWIVLSKNPDEYKYLRFLDCVQLPRLGMENAPPFYSLVYHSPEDPLPLASNALTWTTVAYVLWDQLAPEDLTPEQFQALVDWLHFGGQLIISGPNTLDKFKGTPLEMYLPGSSVRTRNLSGADFQFLNDRWATQMAKNPGRKWELVIPESSPMLGIELNLNPGSKYVDGCDGLVAERSVGRGRIVVTTFPLTDKRLLRWPCLSSLFNGALLRKPAREFGKNSFSELTFRWVDDGASIFDPLLATTLRFASRDLRLEDTTPTPGTPDASTVPPNALGFRAPQWQSARADIGVETLFSLPANTSKRNLTDTWHYGGYNSDDRYGPGTWNDDFGIAEAARERISASAGINPPSPVFVLKLLGVYLVVLVPLNWLVFWLIGRVEWAWFAAPVIAVVGAVTVVKLSALDIGFVRSQSQIGVLELFQGHSRGHLTEYTALYTSLSTRYEVRFDDSTGLVLPFAHRSKTGANTVHTIRPVYMERTIGNKMRDFLVQSNTTEMLHNENFLDVGGALALDESDGRSSLSNGTKLDLKHAGVVRRTSNGVLQVAWIGDLPAGSTHELQFESAVAEKAFANWHSLDNFTSFEKRCREIWDRYAGTRPTIDVNEVLGFQELGGDNAAMLSYLENQLANGSDEFARSIDYQLFKQAFIRVVRSADQKQLGLGEIFDVVARSLELAPGEVRLLAETESAVGQHVLVPQATQSNRTTLVLAHLRRPEFTPAMPDQNTLLDFLGKTDLDWLRDFGSESKDQSDGEETEQSPADSGDGPDDGGASSPESPDGGDSQSSQSRPPTRFQPIGILAPRQAAAQTRGKPR